MDGTEAQKRQYLPRLAIGGLVASFAVIEPEAGSDAGALPFDEAADRARATFEHLRKSDKSAALRRLR